MLEAATRGGGRSGLGFVRRPGRALGLALQLLAGLGAALVRPRTTGRQIHAVGVRALPVMIVAGVLTGMLLAARGDSTRTAVDLASLLDVLLPALAPLAAALLFAARAGSALSAEVGRMKAGEQLSALELIGIDPVRRVLAPRFAAGVLSMPVLALLFCAAAVGGGCLVAIGVDGIDPGVLRAQLEGQVPWRAALLDGAARSVAFGAAVTWIALFEGRDCTPTPAGIGAATRRSVVHAALAVLALELAFSAAAPG